MGDQPGQYEFESDPSSFRPQHDGRVSGAAAQPLLNTSPSGVEAVIPFLRGTGKVGYVITWIVLLGGGLMAVVGGATNSFALSDTGSRVFGIVLGAVFTLAGATMALMTHRAFSRAIVVNSTGIRLDDPRGRAFLVQWSELSQVGVCTTLHVVGRRRHRTGFLDLVPGDPGFAGRHPEMSVLYQRFGAGSWWRLPLGPVRRMVEPLDAALRRFAGQRYHGLGDLGENPQG